MLDHLTEPARAIAELRRVLKRGGVIGLRAGDLGGFLIDTESEEAVHAFSAYIAHQKESQKDPNLGRKLGRLLNQARFEVESLTATYEVITDALRELGPSFP